MSRPFGALVVGLLSFFYYNFLCGHRHIQKEHTDETV